MDSPVKVKGALRRLHLGPGDHPSGSPQSVHAGNGSTRLAMTDYDKVQSSVRSIKNTWPASEARSIALTAMQGDIIHEDATQELYVWERGHVIGVINISAQAASFDIDALESLDAPDLVGDKLTEVYFLASNERGMGTAMMQFAVDVAASRGHGLWVSSEPGADGFYKHIGMKQPILRPTSFREGIPASTDERNSFFYFTAKDATRLASGMTNRSLPDDSKEFEPEDGAFARSRKGITKRHLGPGDHPSGSPQSVHAGEVGGSLPSAVAKKPSATFPERISISDIDKNESVKWGVVRGGRVETLPYEGVTHSDLADVAGIESDVDFAASTGAMLVGLHVKAESNAAGLAKREGISIKLFDIIYKLLEYLEERAEQAKEIKMIDKKIGEAVVRKVFDIKKLGIIAGCYVKEGLFSRDGKVVVWRGTQKIGEGKITSLQREGKTVKEVHTGYECAFMAEGLEDFAEDDRVECFISVPETKK